MAITQTLCNSFKVEIAQGLHDFDPAGDTFNMALFRAGGLIVGTFDANTTNYSDMGADEVTGTGYSAGGIALTSVTPVLLDGVGVLDFADAVFSTVTITSRGALIYNASQANRAVAILDFGSDRVASAQDFTVQFPTADASDAIIRVGV